mgnify:CR=1 FL=1
MTSTLATIPTIDALAVPQSLDGSNGTNRSAGLPSKIEANNDLQAVRAWYKRFEDVPRTHDVYRREAERLMLWAVLQQRKPLSSLSHEDFMAYEEFLKNPQPAKMWISELKLPRANPNWKPFYGALSPSSVSHAMGIINNLMTWLVNANYLAANPLSLRRKKTEGKKRRLTRYLDSSQWEATLRYIETMPTQSNEEIAAYERARWVFRLFYLAGMRISEVCENTMGGFQSTMDSKGQYRWNLIVTGKGSKERAIPVGSPLLSALQRYRAFVGLSPLPSPKEQTPLVCSLRNAQLHQPIGRQAMDKIVKACFKGTVSMLESSTNDNDRNTAMILNFASAHWIRHSAGSHMADAGVDLRHIRDFLGHENIQTTSIYLHADDEARHESITHLHKLPL